MAADGLGNTEKYLRMSPYVDMLIVISVLNSNSHFLNRPQVERVQICK